MNQELLKALANLQNNPLNYFGKADNSWLRSVTKDDLTEFGKDVTPVWGDLRALQRAGDLMSNPVNPMDYVNNGIINLEAFNKANRNRGGEIGLEIGSTIPAIGGSLAGLARLMGTGSKVKRGFNQAGIIGGRNARNADLDALARAEEMKARGVDTDAIYADTKWWLDHPDGKPRFEIDDSSARLTFGGMNDGEYVGDLKGYISNQGAYDNYPWTGYTDTQSVNSSGGLVDYRGGDYGQPIVKIGTKQSGDIRRQVAGHETQHLIDDGEGMASGGSPEMFYDEGKKLLNDQDYYIDQINKQMSENVKIRDRLELRRYEAGVQAQIDEYAQEYQALMKQKEPYIRNPINSVSDYGYDQFVRDSWEYFNRK